jgi:2-hydroxychromene-2-carboxylate isomerase
MGVRVEFVFGLGSRYSYLASTQLDRIAARTGCSFEWTPVSSVALMAARGRTPFRGDPASGQYEWDYRRRDAEDWARYYGVPFAEPKPAPADHALMAVAARAADGQGALQPYVRALFSAVFVAQAEVCAKTCVELAGSLALDLPRFESALAAPSLRARVQADAERCAARGAFGVPWFFVEERGFWGNDRLVLLEHWLTRAA